MFLFTWQVVSDSFATPWTVACQASPSMGFSRQEYWSGLPFPSPGDLPDPGMEHRSPALAGGFFTSEPPGKPYFNIPGIKKEKRKCREFPVGPVVRIWWFYCRGFRVNPWLRTKIPHDTQCFPPKSTIIKHYQILCERVGVIETGWAQSTGMGWDYLVYNYWFYLFDYTRSYLQHSGSLTFDAAYGVFSHGMGTLSYGMWDRVPWQVIKPRSCIRSPES